MTLQATFDQSIADFFPDELPTKLGLAVSGGGDSMALLHLAVPWAKKTGVAVHVATVDHGLREQSAAEARQVGQICDGLGVEHVTLEWRDWDRSGNLQDQARRARIRLIGGWAAQNDIRNVATGHTLNDQAETVLMRLGRGSGVDGLCGIPPFRQIDEVRWLRPLLEVERQTLRMFLRAEGVDWFEDPSNEDSRFDRVKVRKALAGIAALGITPQGLADTARRMLSARDALDHMTHQAAIDLANVEFGCISIDAEGLLALRPEIRRRLLSHALNWVSGAEYVARAAAIAELETAIAHGKTTTLHGCIVSRAGADLIVCREYNAISEKACDTKSLWDGRWRLDGPHHDGFKIAALGEDGLRQCPDWRETGRPRVALLASPAVWFDGELVAAPVAGFSNGWQAETIHNQIHFFSSILSH